VDKEGEIMEFRLEKWHRPLAGCGLVLLLAVLAGAWYADEAEKPPLVLQAGEAEKVVQEDSLAIRGLQEAMNIRNCAIPFRCFMKRNRKVSIWLCQPNSQWRMER
jgi:hypothetical protein